MQNLYPARNLGFRLALVAVLACLTASMAIAQAEPAGAVQDEVMEVFNRLRAAISARDWNAALEFYADDPRFRWIEPGRTTYTSKAEVSAALKSAYEQISSTRFEPQEMEVTALSDELALLVVEYDQEFRFAGGGAMQMTGVMSIVLTKQDGAWRILHGHTTTIDQRME